MAVLFVPWISGAATTPRWALLSIGVPILMSIFSTYRLVTKIDMLGLAFIGWCAVTLAWSPGPYEGIQNLWELLLIAGLFCLGARLPDLRPVVIGFGLGIAVNSGFLLFQMAGFHPVAAVQCCAGLFVNPNFLAEPAALVLIGAIGYRLFWLVPGILPAVLLTGVRGPLVALGCAGLAWLWFRSKATTVALAGVGLVAMFFVITDPAHNNSGAQRMTMWGDMLPVMTPLGNGLGSFYTLYPGHAPHANTLVTRPTHAHNDFLEIAYETGLPGILLFGALLAFALWGRWETERLMLLAFMTEAAFGFPLHFPATIFLAALCAGRLCAGRAVVVDCRDDGRAALRDGLEPVAGHRCGAGPCEGCGVVVSARL